MSNETTGSGSSKGSEEITAQRLKCVPIPVARRLANEHGATRFLILGIDDHGNFAFSTFGRTKAQCDAMRIWADSHVPGIGLMMDRGTK